MYRQLTFEGYPDFSVRSSQQSISATCYPEGMISSEGFESPPTLPPVLLLSRKSSFLNMFDQAPTQSDASEHNLVDSVGDLDCANLSSCAALSQSESCTDMPPDCPRPPRKSSLAYSHGLILHRELMQKNYPVRQISDSSSASRSKHSECSVPLSRPSSSSSVDDVDESPAPAPLAGITHKGVDGSGSTNAVQLSRRDVLAKPSSLAKAHVRSVSIPSGSKDKPLPSAPLKHVEELQAMLTGRRPFGSIRISTPTVSKPKPKRGARLGQQILGSTSDKQDKTLQSSLAPTKSLRDSTPPNSSARKALYCAPLTGSSEASQRIVLGIMSDVSSLDDLKSAAMVNQTFYTVFRRHERDLVSRVLFTSSLPLWELRQVMKCEQKRSAFKMRSVQRDIGILRALQSFIVMKCQDRCKPTTVDGLLGRNVMRRAELDEALWRIWTFCKLFGKMQGQDDLKTQILWLKGGAHRMAGQKGITLGVGNGNGLSLRELEDISEMWQCLEALLSGFKYREWEARRAGLFDQCHIGEAIGTTMRDHLPIWIFDLLALGPKTVLTLSSCSFDQAKVLGLTRWIPPAPGQSRASFLKAAVEEVYRERLMTEARLKATEFERQIQAQSRHGRSVSEGAVRLPKLKKKPDELTVIVPQYQQESSHLQRRNTTVERRVILPDCDPLSPISAPQQPLPTSPTSNPATFSSLAMTPLASARLGATLFPLHYQAADGTPMQATSNHLPIIQETSESRSIIVDPIDKAMAYLVGEMGFPEIRVKQALAMCDDGRGVNVEKAIELLTSGSVRDVRKKRSGIMELPVPYTGPAGNPPLDQEQSANLASNATSLEKESNKKRSRLTMNSFRKVFPSGVGIDSQTTVKQESGSLAPGAASIEHGPSEGNVLRGSYGHAEVTRSGSTSSNLVDAVRSSLHIHGSVNGSSSNHRQATRRNSASVGHAVANGEVINKSQTTAISAPVPTQANVDHARPSHLENLEQQQPAYDQKPRVTLTRIGTGKQPSRSWSIKEGFRKSNGEPPEVIGYAY